MDFARPITVDEAGQRIETVLVKDSLLKVWCACIAYVLIPSQYGIRDKSNAMRIPMSIALTEFHVFLLYEDHYDVICLLNEKIVDSEPFQISVCSFLHRIYA